MWQAHNDFEEEVGQYWEEESEYDARRLSSVTKNSKRVFALRNAAAKAFKRVRDGVSHHHVHGRRFPA